METSTSLHEFSKNNNSISIANITSSDGTPNYQSTSINFQTNNTERKIVVLSPGSYSIKLGFAQPLPLEVSKTKRFFFVYFCKFTISL